MCISLSRTNAHGINTTLLCTQNIPLLSPHHDRDIVLLFLTAPLIQSLDTDDVVVVNDDVTSGVVDVTVPPVSDQQGHIR